MRRALAAVSALALAALAGCAPHRVAPPALDAGALRERYEAQAAARAAVAAAVDAELTLWLASGEGRRLPALDARLALRAPDGARLRVAPPFGTALDLGALGDTLTAYVPPRRVGFELAGAADSLGLESPGALACRAWSAAWRPPLAAWAAAVRSDSALTLRWREGRDSLAAAIDGAGLPLWVEAWRSGGARWRVEYHAWMALGATRWPERIELGDDGGRVRLTARTRLARAADPADRARVVVRVPEGATRWTLAELRRALAALEAW